MEISVSDLLPNTSTGLSKIGFFFGAGTSLAAGYPLTYQLTIDVLKKLAPNEIDLVEKILKTEGFILNISKGEPDIELLSDKLNQAKASGGFTGINFSLPYGILE